MVRITVFGATSVHVGGHVITSADMGGAKPRQILELLALEAGSPVRRDRLADLLWDGQPPASWTGTLDSYICVLRRQLQLGSGRSSLLATTPGGYRLGPEGVNVDIADFRRLTRAALTARPGPAVATIEKAIGLASGDLLADEPYADWAVRARGCFQRDLLTAAVHGSRLASGLGDHRTAERLARAATAADPMSEDAVTALMTALSNGGRRCEALRVFAELRARMIDEFGAEPGSACYSLYLEVLRGPGSAADQAAGSAEVSTLVRLLRQALAAAPGAAIGLSIPELVAGGRARVA